ncbi:MAG: hypothetical protein NTZ05_14685 [Chloroflexi bacterium]|nr:hypothetical protein [Chloroflexota bacterium]
MDGAGAGELRKPAGLVADANGNVFVADAGNHRVLKFASSVPVPTPTATPVISLPTPTPEGQPPATPTPAPTPLPLPFGPPSLLEPPNTFRLPGPFTTLRWDQPFATRQFQVQVTPFNGDGPALDIIVGDRGLAGASRLEMGPAVIGRGPYLLLPDLTYAWRVRVSESLEPLGPDSSGWGPWSKQWTFRTPRTSAEGLSLIAPPMDGRLSAATARLAWDNTASDVFYYEVQVSLDPSFETEPVRATAAVWWNLVHGGQSAPLNSWQTPPLDPGRTYYWRVRPRIQGDGVPLAWGPIWRFRTAP